MTLGLPASAFDPAVAATSAAAAHRLPMAPLQPALAAGAVARSDDRTTHSAEVTSVLPAAPTRPSSPPGPPIPLVAAKARPRSSHLTREQKRLLCIYAKQHPTVTQTQLAQWARERFALPVLPSQSSISHTLKRKHNFEHMKSDELASKRTRSVKFPELDTALANWYLDCLARHVKVQGDEVKAQAHRFFALMGIHTATDPPQFSNGWLHSFQSRHGFSRSSSSRILSGAIATTETQQPPVITTRSELVAALDGVAPYDLYWMDETRLLYCLSPEHTGATVTGPVMTLALCTNADGSDVLDPFVVCTDVLDNNINSPVAIGFEYAHNARAWLSPTVFREWLLALDWQMREANRTIVLLLDTYASHYTKTLALKSVAIRFVASSTMSSSLLAPVERDVVTALKRRYRHVFLDHVLDRRDARAADIFHVEPLQAIQWVLRCWRDVPQALIANSFAKSGVRVDCDELAINAVAATESRLDAQIVALVKRLKLKTPAMALSDFVSPAAEVVQDEALTSQDFVESAVNAALGVRVVGTEIEAPRRLLRGRSTTSTAALELAGTALSAVAGLPVSGPGNRHQPSQTQLARSCGLSTAAAVVTESALSAPASATRASVVATTAPPTTAVADAEWQAWIQSQRTDAASDVQALQRVIRLATERYCDASTVLELNRMLLDVTQTQVLAQSRSSPRMPPKDDTMQSTGVCRFTFGGASSRHNM